ncbi:hypothetical protein G7046_g3454 [Stylonectria norvegica]|nr:hypothetical protein G7046_g3454 [Stylonectria norvegica]
MSASRLTTTIRSAAGSLRVSPRLSVAPARQFHYFRYLNKDSAQDSDAGAIDGLSGGSVKGRTGGGKPLDSSSDNAPPKPKISNLSVPGNAQTAELTEEQKKEVEEHNKDFAAKHDHGNQAPDDKVDKKFWSGRAH